MDTKSFLPLIYPSQLLMGLKPMAKPTLTTLSEDVPAKLLPWLLHQRSLTNKLSAIAGEATLKVHDQSWQILPREDREVLKINSERVYQRNITMSACERVCWFARTIIPETTYQEHKFFFARLATETLGDLIFGEHEVQRDKHFYYSINKQAVEYAWVKAVIPYLDREILWLRLAHFVIVSHPFYLVEIFLPGLEELI